MYELACKNRGATDDATCITNTWQSFSGRGVKAWSEPGVFERELYYYKTFDGDEKTSAIELIQNPNKQGQCNAWADLFRQTLLINGVQSERIKVLPPSNYRAFGVKHIVFRSLPKGQTHSTSNLDLAATGLAGQNMETPKAKLFDVHYIVKAGNTYYDPSYGIQPAGTTRVAAQTDYSSSAIGALQDPSGKWFPRGGFEIKFILAP